MEAPKEILDELRIKSTDLSKIYLILTCAHNVAFKENHKDKKLRASN